MFGGPIGIKKFEKKRYYVTIILEIIYTRANNPQGGDAPCVGK